MGSYFGFVCMILSLMFDSEKAYDVDDSIWNYLSGRLKIWLVLNLAIWYYLVLFGAIRYYLALLSAI